MTYTLLHLYCRVVVHEFAKEHLPVPKSRLSTPQLGSSHSSRIVYRKSQVWIDHPFHVDEKALVIPCRNSHQFLCPLLPAPMASPRLRLLREQRQNTPRRRARGRLECLIIRCGFGPS
jgi:hypothetical protein